MIVSSIQGRIRFSDENIKNLEVADKINKSLESLGGIENIRINRVIGSLLINYDEEKTSLIEITNLLKEYINTEYKPKEIESPNYNYIKKAIETFRAEIAQQNHGKGRENFTVNGIMKYALYSVLGVQGYKKGKGMMQGKGRKNSK